jgi:hypothetical protein
MNAKFIFDALKIGGLAGVVMASLELFKYLALPWRDQADWLGIGLSVLAFLVVPGFLWWLYRPAKTFSCKWLLRH